MKYSLLKAGLFLLFSFTLEAAFAQTIPVRDTIQVNSIQADFESNGAFFRNQFLVPAQTLQAPSLPGMKAAGLWLAGKDAAGNLKTSAQLYNEGGKSDFYPGFLGNNGTVFPDFNLIATASKTKVQEHIANPFGHVPDVYFWPGRGNDFFFDHYGFDLPADAFGLADFYDDNGNGKYDPTAGEYPAVGMRGCPQSIKYFPDELKWFSFHDVGQHSQSGGEPLNMSVTAEVLGMACMEGSPLNRTIFVRYRFINRNPEPLDSCYFGLFLDFEIGNGNDDYIGCSPAQKLVYAYNGDDNDEGAFENTPPVIGVDLLRGPVDGETGEPIDKWHFVPVDLAQLSSPRAYFNLLAGRKSDGTPFHNNGLMYTGNPLNPNQWSEKSDGNIPGDRVALASFGPFKLYPGAVDELILAYFWVRKDPNGTLAENLSSLQLNDSKVQEFFDNCFSLYDEICPGNVATHQADEITGVDIAPNPFQDEIRISTTDSPLKSMALYDALGRQIWLLHVHTNNLSMPTRDLPCGLYWLSLEDENGGKMTRKLVKE